MWFVFGIIAILMAFLNIFSYFNDKETRIFRFLSLSLTALTLCDFYAMAAKSVLKQDWSALMDITPTMSKFLWILTVASILLNSISLFDKKNKD